MRPSTPNVSYEMDPCNVAKEKFKFPTKIVYFI